MPILKTGLYLRNGELLSLRVQVRQPYGSCCYVVTQPEDIQALSNVALKHEVVVPVG